jgi:hypothetical protein
MARTVATLIISYTDKKYKYEKKSFITLFMKRNSIPNDFLTGYKLVQVLQQDSSAQKNLLLTASSALLPQAALFERGSSGNTRDPVLCHKLQYNAEIIAGTAIQRVSPCCKIFLERLIVAQLAYKSPAFMEVHFTETGH